MLAWRALFVSCWRYTEDIYIAVVVFTIAAALAAGFADLTSEEEWVWVKEGGIFWQRGEGHIITGSSRTTVPYIQVYYLPNCQHQHSTPLKRPQPRQLVWCGLPSGLFWQADRFLDSNRGAREERRWNLHGGSTKGTCTLYSLSSSACCGWKWVSASNTIHVTISSEEEPASQAPSMGKAKQLPLALGSPDRYTCLRKAYIQFMTHTRF